MPPTSEYFVNKRGERLHMVCHAPGGDGGPRCLVLCLHGYGHHAEAFDEHLHASTLADRGACVRSLSHHGHGRSEGLSCLVTEFQFLVDDVQAAYQHIVAQAQGLEGLPVFVIGQSMGGAIALETALQATIPELKGLVLLAPMCKLSDNFKFPQWMITLLEWLAYFAPSAPITPVGSVDELCYKDPAAFAVARADSLTYHGRPRLATAHQMHLTTVSLQGRLDKLAVPFFVLHGSADVVTEPSASQTLYDEAQSSDKSITLYEDMWHALLHEPDGGGDRVRADIAAWIFKRC